jgi:transposase InsO family protein
VAGPAAQRPGGGRRGPHRAHQKDPRGTRPAGRGAPGTRRAAPRRRGVLTPADPPAHARGRAAWRAPQAVQAHHPGWAVRPEPGRPAAPRLRTDRTRPCLGRRHHLRQDLDRVGLPGHRDRLLLPAGRRVRRRRPHAHHPDRRHTTYGDHAPKPTTRGDFPLRPRQPGQYTSDEFRDFCRANSVRPSVGRTGICFDDAVAESFFATLKKELVHTRPWPTIDKLRSAVFEYIESYYNRRRRHSTIGYDTPTEYERKHALTRLQAA